MNQTLTASDGHQLHSAFTPAVGEMRAAVHLNHGMGEHQGRYAHVIAALAQAGFAVLAHDHRGHGKTAGLNGTTLGNMTANGASMETWVADMGVARDHLALEVGKDVPIILLGHSMGSFFAQRAVQANPDWYDALILSGSTGRPNAKQRLSTLIPKMEALFRGKEAPAKTFHELTFQDFNRPFKADGHRQAWLSRDPELWKAYHDDELCDCVVFCQSYIEVARMITTNFEAGELARLKTSMPTLMFGGTADALSSGGPGLQRLYDEWLGLGFGDISLKFWEDGRHETMNETNRDVVIGHMVSWLTARF